MITEKQLKSLIGVIIFIILLVIITSCGKDTEICKTCTTIVRYEPYSGGEYREETRYKEDCNNPDNSTTTEEGTYIFKLWWIEKDSSITITGVKTTAVRCD